MKLIKNLVLATLSIGLTSSVSPSPAKADVFDYLRGSVPCEGECMARLQESVNKWTEIHYKHSYRDMGTQYRAMSVCGREHTVAQSRCLQDLVSKAEKKESDAESKAGSMAAQGKMYGRVDRNSDKEVEFLRGAIGMEIERLVEEAQTAAAKVDPDYARKARIYSPAGNNSQAVDVYLDLQEHPRSYRESFCKEKTSFSTTAVCNVMKTALADELE
jgi:hypothetical protein